MIGSGTESDAAVVGQGALRSRMGTVALIPGQVRARGARAESLGSRQGAEAVDRGRTCWRILTRGAAGKWVSDWNACGQAS